MRNPFFIFVFMLAALQQQGQTLKTIVPQLPVLVGESFRVQYILEDAESPSILIPPAFKDFRLIAGPDTYSGSITTLHGIKKVKNSVYTLVALKPGRFRVEGARVTINGKLVRSEDAIVEVISEKEATARYGKMEQGSSEYLLRPGENPDDKIRKNLFIHVTVDKKSCFVGEPVVATFKLYSRLESRSDIIKNPGFYGFTVYDMVNLTDQATGAETINGRLFDVHIIRKVQLYPLQAGKFIIDAMEIKNTVEFSRSIVNKKTEQKIIEGMLGAEDAQESGDANTLLFENSIHTEPIAIEVKPLPLQNKPPDFNGATGNFSLTVNPAKLRLMRNEEGRFFITINGSGNFTQIDAPLMKWPAGIEGFEPTVSDQFDKTRSPLKGSRTFNYGFISATPGSYSIPPVVFSYFDPVAHTYRSLRTDSLQIIIGISEKIRMEKNKDHVPPATGRRNFKWWLLTGLLLVVVAAGFYGYTGKRKQKGLFSTPVQKDISIDNLLQPAILKLNENSNAFYLQLHQTLWQYAAARFGLSGSEMNKQALVNKLNAANGDPDLGRAMSQFLEACEAGIFTNADQPRNKEVLLQEARRLLKAMQRIES